MISSVTFEKTLYNKLPYKFEAGTPNIAGGIAFGAAVGYIESIGLDNIIAHEQDLLAYVSGMLATIDRLRIIGTADDKASILSFTFEGVHSHDIGTILDQEGIAVRSGHHCAQPLMNFFSIPATARVSLGLYNTREDIDALTRGLEKVQELFK